MQKTPISEDMIFECFAAAQQAKSLEGTAASFVDVEEYENAVMYPEFARWARKAGYPEISKLFLKVAGEEKAHATWLRDLYSDMGTPPRGEDTQRAVDALTTIKENCDKLFSMNPDGVVEKALRVAIRVEDREHREIYPRFRDQAIKENHPKAAKVYQRVIDSERQHSAWFTNALSELENLKAVAVV